MARESKTGIRVEDLLASELYGIAIKATGEPRPFPDEAIHTAICDAEADYEQYLELRFQPTRVFSDVRGRNLLTDPSMHVDDFDPTVDIDEAAYDYEPQAWHNDRWGEIQLSYRPIISIERYVLTAPGAAKVYAVPPAWLAVDRRFGTVQIRPTNGPAVLHAFSGLLLGLMSSGRTIPKSIYIDYTTGYEPGVLEARHGNLLRGVRLRAMLTVIQRMSGALTPGGVMSGSLSLDGLSRSRSYGGKWGAYSGAIEMAMSEEQAIRDRWREKERGVPIAFLGA